MLLLASPMWASNVFDFQFANCMQVTGLGSGVTCPGISGMVDTEVSAGLTYASNGLQVIATGNGPNANAGDIPGELFIKNAANGPTTGSETGLGLDGEADDEIAVGSFIQLDVSNLISHGLTNGTLTIGSVQSGEDFEICVTSTNDSLAGASCSGVLTTTGGNIATDNVTWGSDQFVDVTTVINGNVLIAEDFKTASEPSALLLLAIALAGGLLLLRKLNYRYDAS